jgi:F-type H+-transporting ATPase subunit delta
MNYEVDPGLIGGMMIRIGDRVVDSSIKSRLNDLTKELLELQLG